MNHTDIQYGNECEISLYDSIKKRFGDDIAPTTEKYCLYDYQNADTLIELKSRRVKKNTYPDTMIGQNKIDYFLNQNKKCFCVFNYTDGAYFIEITPENVKMFNTRNGGRVDRGRPEIKKYCFIPVNLLEPLCTPSL